LFLAETKRLAKAGVRPKVFIDPAAPVTTPYDMMINQMAEELRGSARHGSCGVGFGETVERQQRAEYALGFADLYNLPKLKAKLELIRTEWVPMRLRKLGIAKIAPVWIERIRSEGVRTRFMQDVMDFLECTRPATTFIITQARHVIFEGSQGLLLDQDHEWFPHVTRSSTGLKNAVTLAKAAGIDTLAAHYVSRCYATRHGAGPLPHELPGKPYEKVVDLTNVPNPYQGTLRFGWLDLDLLRKTIRNDLGHAEGMIDVAPALAVTCLDQADDRIQFIHEGVKCVAGAERFLEAVSTAVPSAALFASYGPTRETVKAMARPAPERAHFWQKGFGSFAAAPLRLGPQVLEQGA
jgi:adenylosuccinate synthase